MFLCKTWNKPYSNDKKHFLSSDYLPHSSNNKNFHSLTFSNNLAQSISNLSTGPSKSLKFRNSSLPSRSNQYEAIRWSNTQAILFKGQEYSKKVIEGENERDLNKKLKKVRISEKNSIIEEIKTQEAQNLALKISKLNEDFYLKLKKLEKETIFQINQEKIDLLSNIEKSKQQAKSSIHSQSLKLISSLFPAAKTPAFIPTSPKQSKSSFSHSKIDLKKSFEALSKTSKQVEIIKSKLLKNI